MNPEDDPGHFSLYGVGALLLFVVTVIAVIAYPLGLLMVGLWNALL